MNNRQFDIISLSVDLELMDLLEESDAAWFGERRNYGTETGNGGIGREQDGNGLGGPDEGERQETTDANTSIPPTGEGVEDPQSPTRSKAANFYGAPE